MDSPEAIFQINSPVLALPEPITVRQFGEFFAELSFQAEAASDDELTFLQIAYMRVCNQSTASLFHPVAYAATTPDRLTGINQFGYGFGLPAALGAGVEVVGKTGVSALVGRLREATNRLQEKFNAKLVAGDGRFIRVAFPNSPLHVWLDLDGTKISPQPKRPESLPALAGIIPFPAKARAAPPPAPV